ncbi:N-acetylmuramoyl-L-alanine amidase [Phreatobacter oligotrophus]|uniref:N-acetylmuramoyl-L-alanine amidase n=1 Tax=Phreatobacter oligotrophus TaxID=1122261 RepID=UPI0023539327|nr:N-acetylmuramoyl-L-alanine amidase [Phreatobacter oligotrophus]MBX9992139.1 N-acetylmuramoyl-L-alanine amidase [Phreatobacter oligotrophus]
MGAGRIIAVVVAALGWAVASSASAQTTGSLTTGAAARATPAAAEAARTSLPAVVVAAHVGVEGQRTRLTFDLTRPVEMRAFALADPYRVIVDLDEVNFHIAPPQAQSRGLVKTFRFGLFAPGKSRIVIELTGPATIERALTIEGGEGTPPRLHLDLVRTDADGFRRAMTERAVSNIARRGDRETLGPRLSPRVEEDGGPPLIVIDPGHGGIDPGAIAPSTGDEEKMIVLDFAKVLRDKLAAGGRYRVLMTRDRDIFVPLADRVRMARDARAQLFISVHADSIRGANENARGVTVYTLSDRASDADSERLAERENKADAIAGLDLSEEPSEVADILIDLTRRETRIYSANFARTLAGEMRQVTRMHTLPLRSAGFQVLRAHDIPSVLVELGFVTSRRDVEMLTSAIWRERTADSVSKAVDQFFAARNRGPVAPAARR